MYLKLTLVCGKRRMENFKIACPYLHTEKKKLLYEKSEKNVRSLINGELHLMLREIKNFVEKPSKCGHLTSFKSERQENWNIQVHCK